LVEAQHRTPGVHCREELGAGDGGGAGQLHVADELAVNLLVRVGGHDGRGGPSGLTIGRKVRQDRGSGTSEHAGDIVEDNVRLGLVAEELDIGVVKGPR
jgi:hypothetical protein